MSRKVAAKHSKFKERTVDVVKEMFAWIIITALAFLYWVALLLVFSLILLNVWKVTFDEILNYSIILTVITSVAYLGRLIYRKLH